MTDLPTFEHPTRPPEYLPGQVILGIRSDAVRPHLGAGGRFALNAQVAGQLPDAVTEPLDYLRVNAGLRTIAPVLSTRRPPDRLTRPQQHRLAVATSVMDVDVPAFAGISVGTLPAKRLTKDLIRHVQSAEAIEIFEPVPTRWLTADPSPDPARNLQWGLRAIGWFGADLPSTADVRVGVVDSGIDMGHPAFEGLHIDYSHNGAGATDIVGHGTHVTGTIAAAVDDNTGIAGLARPRLSVWKVLPDEPQYANQFYIDAEPYVAALYAAASAGLAVVNMSLAGSTPSSSFEPSAIKELLDANVNVVASTGNGFTKGDPVMYPASYDGVVAVGSMAEDGDRSTFSGTGPYIDLLAPGSNILSLAPIRRSKHRDKRRLDVQSGTSMAAAHVSAALALLAAKFPDWTAADRAERLRQTATKLPAMGGRNWTRQHGFGLLNVRGALTSS